jgi:phenylpropionate dioxygenase-like ring-hydroxylating dioxygenase large terminal subunit
MVASAHLSSTYDHVHGVFLHPGQQGMAWHRQFTPGAAYTNKDAAHTQELATHYVHHRRSIR